MSEGWVKLWRRSLQHPCLQKLDEIGMWSMLIMRAAREPTTVRFRGAVIPLQRGQLAMSVRAEAERGGISYKRMRTIIEMFRAENMIILGADKGAHFSIITICKYELFQEPGRSQGHTEGALGAHSGRTEQEGEEEEKRERAAPQPKVTKKKLPETTRLAEDWQPTAADRAFAAEHGFMDADVARIAVGFRNYWTEKRGATAEKARWDKTWESWLSRERPSRPAVGGRTQPVARAAVPFSEQQARKKAAEQAASEGLHPHTSEFDARVAQIMRETRDGDRRSA